MFQRFVFHVGRIIGVYFYKIKQKAGITLGRNKFTFPGLFFAAGKGKKDQKQTNSAG